MSCIQVFFHPTRSTVNTAGPDGPSLNKARDRPDQTGIRAGPWSQEPWSAKASDSRGRALPRRSPCAVRVVK